MNSQLKQKMFGVYCQRDVLFKKYNREISDLVRLDFNIDILPKIKENIYVDLNGSKSKDVLYIDLSTKELIVYNEDLKKCGYYDYDNEQICYYKLPLNKKPALFKQESLISIEDKYNKEDTNINTDDDYTENDDAEKVALQLAIAESLKCIAYNPNEIKPKQKVNTIRHRGDGAGVCSESVSSITNVNDILLPQEVTWVKNEQGNWVKKTEIDNDDRIKRALAAEKRQQPHKQKYKIEHKNHNFEFQDEKIRNLWN